MKIQQIEPSNNFKGKISVITPKLYKNRTPMYVSGCGPFFNTNPKLLTKLKSFVGKIIKNK